MIIEGYFELAWTSPGRAIVLPAVLVLALEAASALALEAALALAKC